jgi:hypothetical protein
MEGRPVTASLASVGLPTARARLHQQTAEAAEQLLYKVLMWQPWCCVNSVLSLNEAELAMGKAQGWHNARAYTHMLCSGSIVEEGPRTAFVLACMALWHFLAVEPPLY